MLLVAIFTAKLDYKLNEEWEAQTADVKLPTYNQIVEFLTKRSKIAETINKSRSFAQLKLNKPFVENKFVSKIKKNCS